MNVTDVNKPYEENTSPPAAGLPAEPAGETNPSAEPLAGGPVDTPSAVQPPPLVVESSVPPPPTVVVPADGGGVPKWFYFLFGVTIISFFLVTTFLVLQLIQNQSAGTGVVPTVAPKNTSGSLVPTPTLTSMLATDSAVVKLNTVGSSDEVASIEAELKSTDLTILDQSVAEVDTQVNNSF